MSGPQILDEIARLVQAAYDRGGEEGQRCLQELMADKVAVHHTPPAPFDGLVERSFLIQHQDEGWARSSAAMASLRLDGAVSVEEGKLVVLKSFSGHKHDGTEVRTQSRAEFVIEEGRIVAAESTGSVVERDFRDAGVGA